AGSCPAPPSRGSTTVVFRFVLDLMLNVGSRHDATAGQSYLTYTFSLLDALTIYQITTTCVLTSVVTPDITTFDAPLQNEVCNGPGQCIFRGVPVGPGSFAYASGALQNCSDGCGGFFRVAQTGWCAVAPGQALLHW